MKEYNGFSPQLRNRANTWLNKEMDSGRVQRPTKCCACGQTKGVMHYHAEDYNEPFGPHIHAFPICYLCHMLVHCRFRSKQIWLHYLKDLRAGKTFLPFMTPNWPRFVSLFLDGKNPAFNIGPERKTLIFDTMDKAGHR